MVAARNNLSRRAVLGAAFALPLVRHPGLDPGSPFTSPGPQGTGIPDQVRNDASQDKQVSQPAAVTKWDRALTHFRNPEAALAAAQGADDIVFNRVLGRFNHASRRLIRAPAPDAASFAAKLALAIDQELTGGDACLAALKRDARRFAAQDNRITGQ